MNAKKLLYGILTFGILLGAACTTNNDSGVYESSIDRDKVVKGPSKNAIDRDKVVKGPSTDAIDRNKVVKGPKKASN